MACSLNELFHYLYSLKERASLPELTARLAQLTIDAAEVAPFMRYSSESYRRNLVRSGPWYNLLVLCWKLLFPMARNC